MLFWKLTYPIRTLARTVVILYREVGLEAMLLSLVKSAYHLFRGEPWRHLAKPSNRKEKKSRQQAGPAIVLYKTLCENVSSEQAYLTTRHIVERGAKYFLKSQIPKIKKRRYQGAYPKDQQSFLQSIVDKFPNATVGQLHATDESFRFEVKQCAFVSLTKAAGQPQLARIFCAADGAYFDEEHPDIIFDRPTTLAEHGMPCEFKFKWKGKNPA
jgi:hypothetical protein